MNDNNDNEPAPEATGGDKPGDEPTVVDTPHDVRPQHKHDLIARGVTVIDKGRRGAPHDVTVKGRTVIDRRRED